MIVFNIVVWAWWKKKLAGVAIMYIVKWWAQ